jgi:predicted nucleic acid-binding protein
MKVFFDANVFVAEALLGGAAERMEAATLAARCRVFCSEFVLEETERVLCEKLGFSRRFGQLTRNEFVAGQRLSSRQRLGTAFRTTPPTVPSFKRRLPLEPICW